tara:strand:+ start:1303 stop:1920 length:618 start_codon:yes stop_codon:yes gene_type:complete
MDQTTQKAIKKFPHRAVDIAQSFDIKQIKSKEWLIKEFKSAFESHIDQFLEIRKIFVLGSWYGQILTSLLTEKINLSISGFMPWPLNISESMIKFYDIDREVLKIAQLYTPGAKFCNQDVTKLKFSGNDKLIINTSCEHMNPIDIKKSIVAFQSNNYFSVDDHINCVNNVEELINQYNFKEIYYSGELDFDRYKRFMVIGKLNDL